MSYMITTSNPQRRARWRQIFGLDSLPVLSPTARWQAARGEFRETEILAYDLDASRLHWMAARRAAAALGIDAGELAGLPIKAGADVVVTAVSDEQERPFVLARKQYELGVFA